MADQLYLSYWLRGFSEGNMLRKFEGLLRTFPFSAAPTAATTLRIYAMVFAEPPLLEVSFARPAGTSLRKRQSPIQHTKPAPPVP